jgi:hypothetical protein
MKIISFIENEEVIDKIFKHLGPWGVKARPRPKGKWPPSRIQLDDSDSHISFSGFFYADPDYQVDLIWADRTKNCFPIVQSVLLLLVMQISTTNR